MSTIATIIMVILALVALAIFGVFIVTIVTPIVAAISTAFFSVIYAIGAGIFGLAVIFRGVSLIKHGMADKANTSEQLNKAETNLSE